MKKAGGCLLILVAALVPPLAGPRAGLSSGSAKPNELVQVHQDFRTDPGWEGFNNRVVGTGCPAVTQDFGWRPTRHCGSGPGEIGGTLCNSMTPASYGTKVGPFSFKDRLSASGRIAIKKVETRGGVYLGFFNSTRQGWRPWSSLMLQLTASKRGQELRDKRTPGTQARLTTVSSTWRSDGMVTDLFIPADGSVHTWSFAYDPDATINLKWPYPDMPKYVTHQRQSEEAIFDQAKQGEPDLTRTELRRRLLAAVEQGLVIYDQRRGIDYWHQRADPARSRGAVTLQIDKEKPRRFFLAPGNRDEPAVLDRFGLVNTQTYGRGLEMYLAELTVNGHRINLARDPGWEGKGNRVTFTERDFHGRHDFGFMETNWAGKAPGEIGGMFWRTEPVDPLHAYYADDVGKLTLDDPLAFSGNVCFVEGQPDSGMWIGYFSKKERLAKITDESAGNPLNQSLGIAIEGPSRIGYYFSPFCCPRRELASRIDGPVFLPIGDKHRFAFVYDPKANQGVGRITVQLDRKQFSLDLTRKQRAAGATFDRFGLVNMRTGGKFVTLYFDDLLYTAGRPKGYRPVRHEQKVLEVPYPKGGRRY